MQALYRPIHNESVVDKTADVNRKLMLNHSLLTY